MYIVHAGVGNCTPGTNCFHFPAPDLDGGDLGPRRGGRLHVRIQNVQLGD